MNPCSGCKYPESKLVPAWTHFNYFFNGFNKPEAYYSRGEAVRRHTEDGHGMFIKTVGYCVKCLDALGVEHANL